MLKLITKFNTTISVFPKILLKSPKTPLMIPLIFNYFINNGNLRVLKEISNFLLKMGKQRLKHFTFFQKVK